MNDPDSSARFRHSQLKVRRLAEPTGFWRWRKCEYFIYWKDDDGMEWEVLTCESRNHDQALKKARKLLGRTGAKKEGR